MCAILPSCGVSEIGADDSSDGGLPLGPVTIEGRTVPRDKIVAFLQVGHSNMAGRASDPADTKPYFYDPDPQLFSLHWQDPVAATGLPWVWSRAVEPTTPDAKTEGRAGPGMALLRAAKRLAGPDMILVSVGHGLSGSYGGHCVAFVRGGVAYAATLGPALALRGKVTWGGIFVMLGTSEADLEGVDDHRGFGACLAEVAKDIREDLGDPEIPFLVGDWEAGAIGIYAPDGPTGLVVAPQIRQITTSVARAAVIPSDGLPMEDDHHYNMDGHETWANRGMTILRDNGWAPWATSPGDL